MFASQGQNSYLGEFYRIIDLILIVISQQSPSVDEGSNVKEEGEATEARG